MRKLFTAAALVLAASSEAAMSEYGIGRASLDATLPDGSELQIELWYPSVASNNRRSMSPDYIFSAPLKSAMVEYLGMPKLAISTKEKGKGTRDAVPAEGSWPLIGFSHGFASFSRQNNRQAEALAEAGYVVAAVSHPGESLTTEYSDGRVVRIDESHPALQYMGKQAKKADVLAMAREMNVHLETLAAADTPPAYLEAMHALREKTLFGLYVTSATKRSQQITAWVQSLIADERIDHPVLRKVDRSRLALYGHSMGGVVSVAASQMLRREGVTVGAVVNLDAPQFLLPAEQDAMRLDGPICFLMGGSTKAGKVRLVGNGLNTVWATHNALVSEVNIAGAAHNNFTDLSWVSALKWFGQLGPIANKKFGRWLNGFLVAYFDHHLKGEAFGYPMWPEAAIEGNLSVPIKIAN